MRLAKLPDKKLVKHFVSFTTQQDQDLQRYATLYKETYGEEISPSQLIPSMVESFLKGDPAFAKVQRTGTSSASAQKSPAPIPPRVARLAAINNQSVQPTKEG